MSYEPTSWCVVFNLDGESGWSKWVPGRFKHVRAYAFLHQTRTWLFYDVNFAGTEIRAIPDGPDSRAAIWEFIGPPGRSYVVSVTKLPRRRRIFPWSNWCTSALRHLLNVPGHAISPDGFYRDCIKRGMPFEP